MANEGTEENETAAKGGGKMITIIAVVVVGLLSGFLGAFLAGSMLKSEAASEEESDDTETVRVVNETMQLDPLTVQLAGQSRKPRFLRLSITLGLVIPLEEPEEPTTDAMLLPKLKDLLIAAIGEKTLAELTIPGGRDVLKQELLGEIKSVFPVDRGTVLELYFTEYLVQ